ncbi:hypothetical protein FHS83_001587 [Rhizomicrobium palustre]|uniref:Ribonuclease VapC n=1 Tax=Rhizomicrobium palustre TaxID=189966 RepID=A0A846MYF7_9PROT|nr:type II toxin-antitoxin system VapC family toxin [Rhizomicrobium palustre]NIK88269.1 hypothetical protein [Rhizomicrobium palustre]
MFLLDTHVVTELRRRERVDEGLAEWAASVAPADLYLSALSLMELEMGLVSLEQRSSARAQPLRLWLETKVVPAFAGRILAIDSQTARRAASLQVLHRRPERNSLIAATALVHGLSLVTRHRAEFEPFGLRLLSPWTVTDNNKGQAL